MKVPNVMHFSFVWGCILFFIYINKNETRCRATTMPLLTTLWVNQLVLFQHHVTADQRAPISLAGVVTWPRRTTASRQVPPTFWFLSMQFPASSSSSSNLNPIDSDPLHIINQSASLLFLFSTQLLCQREQPLAYTPSHPSPPKKAGKLYNYPLQPATKQLHIATICIMWQILSAIRPPSPSVWLPCVISILSKSPKIVSWFYPALCRCYA